MRERGLAHSFHPSDISLSSDYVGSDRFLLTCKDLRMLNSTKRSSQIRTEKSPLGLPVKGHYWLQSSSIEYWGTETKLVN